MNEILIDGSRAEVVKSFVRNAYSHPHAYVLADGSYLSRASADAGDTKNLWTLQHPDRTRTRVVVEIERPTAAPKPRTLEPLWRRKLAVEVRLLLLIAVAFVLLGVALGTLR